MPGLIAIEEAIQVPELAHEAHNHAPGESAERLAANLVDIHEQRLRYMNEYGVDIEVIRQDNSKLTPGSVHDRTRTSGNIRASKSRGIG